MTVLDSTYTDKVEFSVLVPVAEYDDLEKKITESTSGGARIGKGDEVWYGTLNKEVILFQDNGQAAFYGFEAERKGKRSPERQKDTKKLISL